MSNIYYSSNAVDSLISYILDVKPYHSKLSEIVEEYQFFDSMVVNIDDQTHLTKTKVAGVWDSEFYSNGLFSQDIDLPFFQYSKSSSNWNNTIRITTNATQIPGLNSAYYLHHNIGLRAVTLDGVYQIEGIDFHVSHGAFTFNLDGASQTYKESIVDGLVGNADSEKIKGLPIHKEFSYLHYQDVNGLNGKVHDIEPNLDAIAYEEWEVKCVTVGNIPRSESSSFSFAQTVPSNSWNIQHNLDTTDLFVQVFHEEADGFHPVYPAQIKFLNSNVINVEFSNNATGKVKIIKCSNSSLMRKIEVPTSQSEWIVSHDLGTQNLIISVKSQINGNFEIIYPAEIEILDSNSAKIKFSSPQNGIILIGSAEAYTSKTFEQSESSNVWVFDNQLAVDSGIFCVYTQENKIIFPRDIAFSKDKIFVTFSNPLSGKLVFTKVFAPGNENTVFTISGSESGLIGYAKLGIPFKSSKINLTISPHDETSRFELGETYVLTPDNRVVSHKNYLLQETWSLIKVNPIALASRPTFVRNGSPLITDITLVDSVRPQQIIITLKKEGWFAKSSIDGDLGYLDGNAFSHPEFNLTISLGNVSPEIGDYFDFNIYNDAPYVSGFDVSLGYDLADYDSTEYDDHLIYFTKDTIGLEILNTGVKTLAYELVYTDSGKFTVKAFAQRGDTTPIETFPDLMPGEKFDNGEISFTIPANENYIVDDTIVFDIVNPPPGVNPNPIYLISKNYGHLTVYPKSFINSPAQNWIITIIDSDSFSVEGSVTGSEKNGKLSESYDNGLLHFTIFPSRDGYHVGDRFFVSIQEEKPSYLVFGSVSGFEKPATVGKWYWNGKIGFKIDSPYYQIEDFTTNGKIQRKLLTGKVTIDQDGRSIEFISPPRYDAKNDVYLLGCEKNDNKIINGFETVEYENNTFIPVSSGNRGIQKGVKVGQRYFDDMRPEQSVLQSEARHDGVVDFILADGGNKIPSDFSLKFAIAGNKFNLYHGNDLIITKSAVDLQDSIFDVEREVSDKIFLKTNSKRKELCLNPDSDLEQQIPLIFEQQSPFSDESKIVKMYSSLIGKYVGQIKNPGTSRQFFLEIDDNGPSSFFAEFLPFNTTLNSKVIQSSQENSIVKARITEKFKVFDFFRFNDDIQIGMNDSIGSHQIDTGRLVFADAFSAIIDDKSFRGFLNGYDILPFDEEAHGYEDTKSVQFKHFTSSAGGIGYQVQERDTKNSVSSKVSETLVIYSKLTDSASGWEIAKGFTDLPETVDEWDLAKVADGLPVKDIENWDNANFDITYDYNPLTDLSNIFEATLTTNDLRTPQPGSPLYGTPYTSTPSSLIEISRKVARITIIKNATLISTAVFYSDLSLGQQIPTIVVENTSKYLVLEVPSNQSGSLVVF